MVGTKWVLVVIGTGLTLVLLPSFFCLLIPFFTMPPKSISIYHFAKTEGYSCLRVLLTPKPCHIISRLLYHSSALQILYTHIVNQPVIPFYFWETEKRFNNTVYRQVRQERIWTNSLSHQFWVDQESHQYHLQIFEFRPIPSSLLVFRWSILSILGLTSRSI